MCGVCDAVATRKVCHKSEDLKYVKGNLHKCLKRIVKGAGGIEMTILIDSV